VNAELAQLYAEDQRDRDGDPMKIDWPVVVPRDEARRRRVAAILDAGGATSADDYRHAAMIFQHGPDIADTERAHALARQAVALDPTHMKARWLVCASEDRLLRRRVDDEERARWGVPPLARPTSG